MLNSKTHSTNKNRGLISKSRWETNQRAIAVNILMAQSNTTIKRKNIKLMNFSWNLFIFLVSDFDRRWTPLQTKSSPKLEIKKAERESSVISSSITSWRANTCRLSIDPLKANYFSEEAKRVRGGLPDFFHSFRATLHCRMEGAERLWIAKQQHIPEYKSSPGNKFVTRSGEHTRESFLRFLIKNIERRKKCLTGDTINQITLPLCCDRR